MDVSATDVRRWIESARAGSQDDFGRLMANCRNYLLLIADQELDEAMLAKGGASDLVQETYLQAQRRFPSFLGETEEELRAWLRQILRYHLLRFRKRYRRAGKRTISKEIPIETVVDMETKEFAIPARDPSPSERIIAQEQITQLKQALRHIPKVYARVIILRHRDGMSFQQIGDEMGRTPQAARKLWARAVEALQNEIHH